MRYGGEHSGDGTGGLPRQQTVRRDTSPFQGNQSIFQAFHTFLRPYSVCNKVIMKLPDKCSKIWYHSYLIDEIVAVLANLVEYLVGSGAPGRVLGLCRHREAKQSGPAGFHLLPKN